MRASKESAEIALLVLQRNGNKLSAGDYDALHSFIKAAKNRLPSKEAYERDALRKRGAKLK